MKFPGALKLKIVYDSRCRLASGSSLSCNGVLMKNADGSIAPGA